MNVPWTGSFFLSLFLVSTYLLPYTLTGLVLDSFIRHYEPLFYDQEDITRQRVKRDAGDDFKLTFHAHNRKFSVRIRRDVSLFTDDAIIESTDGNLNHLQPLSFSGHLEDESESRVDGILTEDGIFDGTIETSSDVYHVEPATRYFEQPQRFHSVIYKASDVVSPQPFQQCASQRLYANSILLDSLLKQPVSVIYNSSRAKNYKLKHFFKEWWSQRTKAAKKNRIDSELYSGIPSRSRRAIPDPNKTTCMLYLQGDHLFYEQMGSEKACIESMTRHVQRVNAIYKNIDFNGDGIKDNINFMIKRIKVHTDKALQEKKYRFPGNYGVEKFLEIFSEEDYDAFCLAYMFTFRDFEGGTLGLAWTGDLKNAGGVCEKNGHYRGSLKSLNTGIVTLLNYGKRVPPAVSHVTLAHEIGHNFGSPHDPEKNKECTPGGSNGNYIMFARATSGDKANNNQFSPCSLKSINNVLNAKARDAKGCFTAPKPAICGNEVVEDREECDCGWEGDCNEDCCWPMRTNPPLHQKPCTLKPHRLCSPSQGPCCTADCQLRFGIKCRDDNGCRDTAFCNGRSPQCPPSIHKPNKTICNEEFVCYKGQCTGSICLAYGLESCQCERSSSDSATKSCELCCKQPGENQQCISSFEWNDYPYDIPDLYSKPGTPCDNYNGYCDVFQKCREVDPSGPLSTLRQLFLSSAGLANLQKWMQHHWYSVLIALLGLIISMVTVVRLFGKSPPVGKKKKKTIYHSDTEFRVEGTTSNHVVHPLTVRQKLPFRKKVREGKQRSKSPRKASLTIVKPGHIKTKTPSIILSHKGARFKLKKSTEAKRNITKKNKKEQINQSAPREKKNVNSSGNVSPKENSSPKQGFQPRRNSNAQNNNDVVEKNTSAIVVQKPQQKVSPNRKTSLNLDLTNKNKPTRKTSMPINIQKYSPIQKSTPIQESDQSPNGRKIPKSKSNDQLVNEAKNTSESKQNNNKNIKNNKQEIYKKRRNTNHKDKRRHQTRSPEKRLTRSGTPEQHRRKLIRSKHSKIMSPTKTNTLQRRTKEWVAKLGTNTVNPDEYTHESLYAVSPITTPTTVENIPDFTPEQPKQLPPTPSPPQPPRRTTSLLQQEEFCQKHDDTSLLCDEQDDTLLLYLQQDDVDSDTLLVDNDF